MVNDVTKSRWNVNFSLNQLHISIVFHFDIVGITTRMHNEDIFQSNFWMNGKFEVNQWVNVLIHEFLIGLGMRNRFVTAIDPLNGVIVIICCWL